MSQGTSKNFTCPHCRKRFQWSTKIADRKAQCPSCSKRIRIPMVPGRIADAIDPLPKTHVEQPQAESDTYDLDLTGVDESVVEPPPSAAQQAAAQTGRCPACNQSINPGAVICVKCGYNLKKGKRMQTAVADGDAPAPGPGKGIAGLSTAMPGIASSAISRALDDKEDEVGSGLFKDLWLPLILIIAGLAGEFISQLFFYADTAPTVVSVLISVGVELAVRVPLMLVAMIVAVKLLDVAFGPLGQALLKLCAVVLGPSAIVGAIALLTGGGLVGLLFAVILSIGFYWLLIHILFDLDGTETILFIIIITIINRVAEIAIVTIISSLII